MKKSILLLFVLTFSHFLFAQNLPFDPISYYKFSNRNGSSISIEDETERDNDAKVTNGLTFFNDRRGTSSQCVGLGGADNYQNYITINPKGDRPTINALENLTVSFWFKKKDATGTGVKPFFAIADKTGKNYLLEYNIAENKIQWSHNDGSNTSTPIVSSALTIDTWYNIAFTVDVNAGKAILYINGTEQGESNGTIVKPVNASISLARKPDFDLSLFAAYYDDLYIYDKVLTSENINILKDYCGATPPVTQGDSNCGSGTLQLKATGSDLKWYEAPAGGALLAEGSNYFTPTLQETTTFYVSSTSEGCESSRIQVTAIINDIPEVSDINGSLTVYLNGEYSYSVLKHEGSIYDWRIFGGTGESDTNEINILWDEDGMGTVSVTETLPNGCSSIRKEISVSVLDTDAILAPDLISESTKLYPNPSSGSFSIDCPAIIEEVTLINLVGQKMTYYSQNINSEFKGLVIAAIKTNMGLVYQKVDLR